jgi:glyoxylase-like metal-dependent hydrolase (beta-lactamase superfamily II)
MTRPELRVVTVVTEPLENNVYLVACARTGDAVIVDAAGEAERILDAAAGLRVRSVLTTHGHPDHIGAARQVSEHLGVPFRIHPADVALTGLEPDLALSDGEEIPVGEGMLRVVHTPGHTPGSVCFSAPPLLFSGDTLFPGGPGKTGDPERFAEIMRSLEDRLFTLPDDTVVFPGHGPRTTIGTERPALPEWWRRGW